MCIAVVSGHHEVFFVPSLAWGLVTSLRLHTPSMPWWALLGGQQGVTMRNHGPGGVAHLVPSRYLGYMHLYILF